MFFIVEVILLIQNLCLFSNVLGPTAVILLASYIVWFRGNRAREICADNAQQLDQQSCI